MKQNSSKKEPVRIKPMTFQEVLLEASEKARKSEENFQKTGLCQANVEVSKGKWEPCKRLADPKNPEHLCAECLEHRNKLLQELSKDGGFFSINI